MMSGGWKGYALGIASLIAVAVAYPSSAADATCDDPSPKVCDAYTFAPSNPRWRLSSDGTRIVDFYINATQPYVPEDTAIAAIRAAFENWRGAVPGVEFRYRGTTPRPPRGGDGLNVVGFLDTYLAEGRVLKHWAMTGWRFDEEGPWFQEVDTAFNPYFAWFWDRCEKADGSCTPVPRDDFFKRWYITGGIWPFPNGAKTLFHQDIESVMTHEVGHWLGLGHVSHESTRHLTMSALQDSYDPIDRSATTLGLGDVLGARVLYPCGCPLPQIVEP